MKTKNLLRLIAAMMLISISFVFFGFKTRTPLKKSVPIVRVKKAGSNKSITYDFQFYNGNEFVLIGRGTQTSGTITNFVEGCVGGDFVTSGTCSGTYTVSGVGGVCTISVNVTPSGHPLETYSGTSAYSTTPLTITGCGQ